MKLSIPNSGVDLDILDELEPPPHTKREVMKERLI